MKLLAILTSFCLLLACNNNVEIKNDKFEKSFLGISAQNDSVYIYRISNDNNIEVSFTNIGAALISIKTPDKNGKFEDIILGYENNERYLKGSYFGTIVGRFANRIDKGKFVLDSIEYQLTINQKPNHLHGGKKGFSSVFWEAEPIQNENSIGIRFTYLSKDGEEGYPGNLSVQVDYLLNNDDELIIEYHAETDKATIVNLSIHPYFNLGGLDCKSILEHQIQINADYFTPVNSTLIPTGEIRKVEGTPMDFRTSKTIKSQMFEQNTQLGYGKYGYDHNWVLNKETDKPELAIKVKEPISGRVMEIHTTEPGLQIYPGNFFNGRMIGKSGKMYIKYAGLVLEPQHFPDSPNHPEFPSVVLRPEEKYYHKSVYKFYVEELKPEVRSDSSY